MNIERFEELYEEHAEGLLAFLVYRTGDRTLAEEVLADTFERVLRSRRSFDPRRAAAKTWVYSIALNRLRDLARRQDAERRALERGGVEDTFRESEAQQIEDRSTVQGALAALAEPEREAVSLRYGADLTLEEVADVLGVKVSTAEGRIYRGLRRLRELLEEFSAPR